MKKIQFKNNKNAIAKILKVHRVQNGLTPSQLAAKMQTLGVNLDQQMLSKIEHNACFVTDYGLACFCLILKTTPANFCKIFLPPTPNKPHFTSWP